MDKNREVLKHCPHFYTIINFEYYSDDVVSEKLIDIYQRYIFAADITKTDVIEKIEKLDAALNRYISDYCFREQAKSDIMNVKVRRGESILESIVSAIIGFFDSYQRIYTRKVPVTRWI